MAFLSKKIKSTTPVVIFDIGSGSVGAALVTFEKEGKPTILYSIRAPITFQKEVRPNLFIKRMLHSLESVALELEQKGIAKLGRGIFGRRHVGEILCVFSSPWYTSQTKILTYARKKSFTVSKDFIEKILTRAKKHFEKSVQESKKELVLNPKIIEANVIYTTLNGYRTNNPYGRKTQSVETAVFFSLISGDVCRMVNTVLNKVFNSRNITFHSFALASFSVTRDIYHTENNFLLIDIGGEITDISLVREGVLLETISFPAGKNSLLRGIAKVLNTIPEEAHSLVRTYIEKKNNSKNTEIKHAFDKAEKEWQASLQKALSDLSGGLSLPKTIFLTADSDLGEWFKGSILSDSLSQQTFISGEFFVILLNEKVLSKYYKVLNGVKPDPFLALESLFFHKILSE